MIVRNFFFLQEPRKFFHKGPFFFALNDLYRHGWNIFCLKKVFRWEFLNLRAFPPLPKPFTVVDLLHLPPALSGVPARFSRCTKFSGAPGNVLSRLKVWGSAGHTPCPHTTHLHSPCCVSCYARVPNNFHFPPPQHFPTRPFPFPGLALRVWRTSEGKLWEIPRWWPHPQWLSLGKGTSEGGELELKELDLWWHFEKLRQEKKTCLKRKNG